jgi:hypothetical protein
MQMRYRAAPPPEYFYLSFFVVQIRYSRFDRDATTGIFLLSVTPNFDPD